MTVGRGRGWLGNVSLTRKAAVFPHLIGTMTLTALRNASLDLFMMHVVKGSGPKSFSISCFLI